MSRKKANDEIELAFGVKQVSLLLLCSGAVLGASFFWGHEAGHRKALRGEPSFLGFLGEKARPHAEPVNIPPVLLEPPESELGRVSSGATPGGPTSKQPPSAKAVVASETRRGPVERVKPKPATAPPPSAEPAIATAPEDKPAAASRPATPPARERTAKPATSSSSGLHYQVAALGVRKNAKALVDLLRSEGFPARIQPARDDGLYRVLVGPFPSGAEAEDAQQRLRQDGFQVMARRF